MWSHEMVADVMSEALTAREQALREEQAVYGLDALGETEIHPLLAAGFAASGLGVLREQAYPTQWKRKRRDEAELPRPRDRERCDIVLTASPGGLLRDSLTDAKSARRRRGEVAGTLFEQSSTAEEMVEAAKEGVAPEEAYWLELKVVAQFSVESGVPGPNRVYGSQLTRVAAADIGKLSCDRTIVHGGLALVLFTANAATAEHDSGILLDRLVARGLRIGSPVRRSVAIQDRIGNALCSVVLVPLRPAPPIDD